jgi:glutaredoxin-related protein
MCRCLAKNVRITWKVGCTYIVKRRNNVIHESVAVATGSFFAIYSYNKFREEVCQFECRISIPQLQVRGALSGG